MLKNKNFKMKKGVEAILEVSILIISIFAIGYLLGDEFRLVSASGDDCTSAEKAKGSCGVTFTINGKSCVGTKCAQYYDTNGNLKDDTCLSTGKCAHATSSKKCVPKTCAQLGYECGIQEDGCGAAINCGNCVLGSTCTNGKCVADNPISLSTVTNAMNLVDKFKDLSTKKTDNTKDTKTGVGGTPNDCGTAVGTTGLTCMIKSLCKEGTIVKNHCGSGNTYCCMVNPTASPEVQAAPTFAKNALDAGWNILGNALLAFGLYGGINLVGITWFKGDTQFVNNLAADLAWGYGIGAVAGSFAASMGVNNWLSNTGLNFFGVWIPGAGLIGLGVGAVTFVLFEKQYSYDTVIFNCNSWQPVTGGSKCEQCNKGLFPCTKYKCQSLGQSCELVNEGTGDEICLWNDRNDISPPTIRAGKGVLSAGYEYIPDDATLAPDTGVIIKNTATADGCAPPYTTLKYGVALDKPGLCKVDTVRKTDYDSMGTALSSGMFKYNHTLISYSGGINTSEAGLSFANGGEYSVYVRCQSKNGYSNVGTFVFKYCVSDEPDTSAPTIIATDPINGNPVAYGQTDKDVNIYVNKPSECKWSHSDLNFDLMEGEFSDCLATTYNANIVFKCSTTLSGLKDGVSNTFYMRCKSYPGEAEENRYKNVESYKYTLIGTRPLVLDWVKPNGTTIKDSTTSVNVTLESHTSAGYKEGEAQCYYKDSSQTSEDSYVLFFSDASTYNYEHSQALWLEEGSYSYDVKCCDLGGNCEAATTGFDVETDTDSPMVIRIYNDNNKLKIVTDERAECVYSTTDCNYLFTDGLKLTTSDYTEHLAEWNTASNLYIKCQDEFGNQPDPNACTITVRPFSEYTTTTA